MKLNKLELQAFGPFKEKVTIDFTNFASNQLILITGATGAGKSSIFDAIYYAFYGRLANAQKDSVTDSIKSDFTGPETECFVSLTFEHQGEVYQLKRFPKQNVIGVRGKPINQEAQAYLTGNSLVLDRTLEVNQQVESLIGLNATQFKQIVLLPQGAFQELLLASSKDKVDLFRRIFGTEQLSDFTASLKAQSQVAEAARLTLKNKLDILINQLPSSSFPNVVNQPYPEILGEIEQALNLLTNQLIDQSHHAKALETNVSLLKNYQDWQTKFDQTQQQLTQLDQQAPEITQQENLLARHQLASQAALLKQAVTDSSTNYQNLTLNLTKTTTALKQIETSQNELTIQFAQTQVAYQKLPVLRTELQTWEKAIADFNTWEKLTLSLKQDFKQETEIKQALVLLNQDLSSLENKLAQASTAQHQLNNLLMQLETQQRIQAQLIQHLKYETELKQLNLKFDAAQTELAKTYQDYTYKQAIYHQQVAGRLAETLKDNEPCPVCGSSHHPHKAQLIDEKITKASVEAAEKLYQAVIEQLNELKQTETALTTLLKEYPSNNETDLTKLASELTNLTNQKTRLESLVKQQADLSEQQKVLTAKQLQATATLAQLAGIIQAKSQQVASLKKQLPRTELAEINLKVETIKNQIDNLETTYQNESDLLQKLHLQQTEYQTSLHHLMLAEKQLLAEQKRQTNQYQNYLAENGLTEQFSAEILSDATTEAYTQKIKTFYAEQTKQIILLENLNLEKKQYPADLDLNTLNSVETKLSELKTDINLKTAQQIKLTDILTALTPLIDKEQKLAQQNAELWELADLAQGNKTTGYLSFENYVLSELFEKVVELANLRLQNLSLGQYRFEKAQALQSRARSSGLDLEVFDSYTGQSRSVKTLSGGETFYASLALALGLSDVISHQLGGVSLDFLFIDEGFGHLDSNTLDHAINALVAMSDQHELIGIISHVSDLKERILTQIIVNKTPQGSTLTFQY